MREYGEYISKQDEYVIEQGEYMRKIGLAYERAW